MPIQLVRVQIPPPQVFWHLEVAMERLVSQLSHQHPFVYAQRQRQNGLRHRSPITGMLMLSDTDAYIGEPAITLQSSTQNKNQAGVCIRESHPNPSWATFFDVTEVSRDADAEIDVKIPTGTHRYLKQVDTKVSEENEGPAANRQLPTQISPRNSKEPVIHELCEHLGPADSEYEVTKSNKTANEFITSAATSRNEMARVIGTHDDTEHEGRNDHEKYGHSRGINTH